MEAVPFSVDITGSKTPTVFVFLSVNASRPENSLADLKWKVHTHLAAPGKMVRKKFSVRC